MRRLHGDRKVLFYYYHDGGGGGKPLWANSPSGVYVQCVKTFEDAVDRLGPIAEELDGLAQSATSAIAVIEAQGDRIDRLQADNRAMLTMSSSTDHNHGRSTAGARLGTIENRMATSILEKNRRIRSQRYAARTLR